MAASSWRRLHQSFLAILLLNNGRSSGKSEDKSYEALEGGEDEGREELAVL